MHDVAVRVYIALENRQSVERLLLPALERLNSAASVLLGSRKRPLQNIWRALCTTKQDILDSSKAIDFDCRGTDPELGIQITLDLESTP
jgi:hypothetical protein